MLTKRELKTLWGARKFRPLKRLGQNFLIDKNIKDKIARNLELGRSDTVLEIGAGFGELTACLAGIAKTVFAVEKDPRICEILRTSVKMPENVTLIEKDFLDMDLAEFLNKEKAVIYGNIPYYATSPIIEKIFDNAGLIKSAYLVIQKEVADRILARPGSKDRSRLSLYVEYHAQAQRVFNINRNSFYPTPLVESVFIKFDILKKKGVNVKSEKALFGLIKKAFSQKRKTILNSASSGYPPEKTVMRDLLEKAKINPMSRPQDLSLEDFASLANSL